MESPPEEDPMPPSPSSSSSSPSVLSPFSTSFLDERPPRKVLRSDLASPHPQVGLLSPSQRRVDNNKEIQEANSIMPSPGKKPPLSAQFQSRLCNASNDTKRANILHASSHDNTNISGPFANFTTSSRLVPSNLAANFSMNQAAVNSVNHRFESQYIIRSCNCRISKCAKKYCRCIKAKVACSTICECKDCQNSFGRRPPCKKGPRI